MNKKIFAMMSAVMAVMMSLSFASCGDDDGDSGDSGHSENSLVGWYIYQDNSSYFSSNRQKIKDEVISIVTSHLNNGSNPFNSDGQLTYYQGGSSGSGSWPPPIYLVGNPGLNFYFIHIANKNTMFYTDRIEYYKKDCPAVAGRDLIFTIKTGTSAGDIGAYPTYTAAYTFEQLDNKLWVAMPEWIFTVYNSTLIKDGGSTYVPLPFKIGEAL